MSDECFSPHSQDITKMAVNSQYAVSVIGDPLVIYLKENIVSLVSTNYLQKAQHLIFLFPGVGKIAGYTIETLLSGVPFGRVEDGATM